MNSVYSVSSSSRFLDADLQTIFGFEVALVTLERTSSRWQGWCIQMWSIELGWRYSGTVWILNSISSHSFQMNFICICIHAEFQSKFIHIHFKWIFLVFVFLLNSKVNFFTIIRIFGEFQIQFPHIYFIWISFVFVFMLNSKVFLSTFNWISWISLVFIGCIQMYWDVLECIQMYSREL